MSVEMQQQGAIAGRLREEVTQLRRQVASLKSLVAQRDKAIEALKSKAATQQDLVVEMQGLLEKARPKSGEDASAFMEARRQAADKARNLDREPGQPAGGKPQ